MQLIQCLLIKQNDLALKSLGCTIIHTMEKDTTADPRVKASLHSLKNSSLPTAQMIP